MVKVGEKYRARNDRLMMVREVHGNGSFRATFGDGNSEGSIIYKADGTPLVSAWNDFSIAEALCHGATGKIEVDPFKQERIIERRFHPGKKYNTRCGHEAGIDSIRETDGSLMGWINFPTEGRTTACWFPDGSMTNGRVKEDPYDLMPSQEDAIEQPLGALDYVTESGRVKRMVQSIDDVTPDRLSIVESSLRDVHLLLQTIRGNNAELIASMATKIEQALNRLDGTDRRVAAINAGLKDAGDLLLKHEDRIATVERNGRYAVFDRRVAAVEATLARIEDMLTSESNRKLADLGTGELVKAQSAPEYKVKTTKQILQEVREAKSRPRKSIGWFNFEAPFGRTAIFYPDRMSADRCAGTSRLACVEIFEGDGL